MPVSDRAAGKYIDNRDKTFDLDLLSSHFMDIENFESRYIEKGDTQIQTNRISNLVDIF